MGCSGPSLATVRRRLPDVHFALQTTFRLAAFMLLAILDIRHLGFACRDIKFPNFVLKPVDFSPWFTSTSDSGADSSISNRAEP
jgi:hypothetical protein